MAKSNKSILEHILSYCNEIQTTMLRFGDNLDTFINAHDDISHLKLFCEQELKHMELLNASGMETESYDENEWGQ